VLALMSKPISLPLPVLLLLVDYWPLMRLKPRAVVEKVPLFIVGVVFAIITYISQSRTSGTMWPGEYGLARLPLVLCHNIVFYLSKMLWPVHLSSHYPFPAPLRFSEPAVLRGVLGSCVLVFLLVLSLRWTRALFTGWLFFFIGILPTMQIVQFSNVIASDKFAYVPSIGLLMVLAWLLNRLWVGGRAAYGAVMTGTVVLVFFTVAGGEAVATRRYLACWDNSIVLYKRMLNLAPEAGAVHNMLGHAYALRGRDEQAIMCFRNAIKADPNDYMAQFNLGLSLRSEGRIDEAIVHYRRALEIVPDMDFLHNNLAVALAARGEFKQAEYHCRHVIRISPEFAESYGNLGIALAGQNRLDEAIGQYQKSLDLNPDCAAAHNNLALALAAKGRYNEAILHYNRALEIDPSCKTVHCNLYKALLSQGRNAEALAHLRESFGPHGARE